jgi:hypothetical protein
MRVYIRFHETNIIKIIHIPDIAWKGLFSGETKRNKEKQSVVSPKKGLTIWKSIYYIFINNVNNNNNI